MSDVTIGLVGATGALGAELLRQLEAAPWAPARVVPMARAATQVPSVEFRGQHLTVEDVQRADEGTIDLVIVACPTDAAPEVVDQWVAAGIPVVDCTGHLLGDLEVPVAAPWLGPAVLDVPRARDVVGVPGPVATVLASVLQAFEEEGSPIELTANGLVPANAWGRDAVHELSQQVIALFNSGTPQRRVFEGGLAFDTHPLCGPAGGTGWTSRELLAVAEVARLTGQRCTVTLTGVPVFSGWGLHVEMGVPADWPLERVERTLERSGVSLQKTPTARTVVRPRRVDGEPGIFGARLRLGHVAGRAHVWLAFDGLVLTATQAVGLSGHWLRKLNRLGA